MSASPTFPNLITTKTFSYKDVLVKKVVRAVICSIISHVLVFLIYVTIANVNIFHPVEWASSVFATLSRISTWISVIIFSFVIFAQCLIYAKDYVVMTNCYTTRFQQFLYIFSFHNFTLLSLHIAVAGGFVWLVTSIIGSDSEACKATDSCLKEESFFLISGGFWTGFYFYCKSCSSSKQLGFPVVHQRKFSKFREHISVAFKASFTLSIWPTVYFVLFYYTFGNELEIRFVSSHRVDRSISVVSWIYLWWFASCYYFSAESMKFFFNLFLTEPVEFPIVKENIYVLTLQEGLVMNNLPVVQHLACLDLFMLAQWSLWRRQLLFTLSQPGGHPHNWNALVESVIKLLTDYTSLLKKWIDTSQSHGKQEKPKPQEFPAPFTVASPQSPTCPGLKYRNLRNMSLVDEFFDSARLAQSQTPAPIDDLKKYINDTSAKAVNFVKTVLGINFLFGELPQVGIRKCLGNGQLIIWVSQGISALAIASLTEDKYGIVQKDLPVIITSLVKLKQTLDQLSKLPASTRKIAALDDFHYKMRNAVSAAIKRSLFLITLKFGCYFEDFPLSPDVRHYLQVNMMPKNYK